MTDANFLKRNPNYFKEYYLRNREIILNRAKARKKVKPIDASIRNNYQRMYRILNKDKQKEYAKRYRLRGKMLKYIMQNNSNIDSATWTGIIVPYIKKINNFKCSKCLSTRKLQVHHMNYNDQTLKNLTLLCINCHAKCHQKVIDKKQLIRTLDK